MSVVSHPPRVTVGSGIGEEAEVQGQRGSAVGMSDGVDAKAKCGKSIADSPDADTDDAVQDAPDEVELREQIIADADEVSKASREQAEKWSRAE